VGELDVAQAASNVYSTESRIPMLEEELQVALNRLCILLGESPNMELANWIGESVLPVEPGLLAPGVPADLIRRRPDVRRAEREVAAASARIGVAVADLYPQFTIKGTISVDSRDISSLFEMPSLVHNVGPSFRWDILNFGRVRNRISGQRARHNEAIINYQNTLLLAVEEVENAVVAYHRSRQRVASLSRAAEAAGVAARLSGRQYERGLITFQTLLDSERERLSNEEQLAISRGTVLLSLVRTFKAVGGGWQSPMPGTRLLPPVDTEIIGAPEPQVASLAGKL
jgi:NodT family efflux transporter outer membrane factor (OMF) lipoprotein